MGPAPPLSKMKKVNPTNIVLGIIAAEVVLLTVKAFAECLPAAEQTPRRENQRGPQKAAAPFLIVQALRRVIGEVHRLILGLKPDFTQGSPGGQDVEQANDYPSDDPVENFSDTDEVPAEAILLKGDMQGVAVKLKDPAWAGVLAANDGNVSLTNAERAVPMPNPGQLVERLDRNPYVGKGMKDHSRK